MTSDTTYLGIVGHEGAKFTEAGEAEARRIIRAILQPHRHAIVVSGHCHLGGIDIWAEEEAAGMGRDTLIFPPAVLSWDRGFKPRNIQIAEASAVVHNIVVRTLAPSYRGMRFKTCYHCDRFGDVPPHVKSGGCWTARYAVKLGKRAVWHVVDNVVGGGHCVASVQQQAGESA